MKLFFCILGAMDCLQRQVTDCWFTLFQDYFARQTRQMPGLRLKLSWGGVMKQIGSGGTWRSAFPESKFWMDLTTIVSCTFWLISWRYAFTEVWCHPVWNEEFAILWPAFCLHYQLGRRPRRASRNSHRLPSQLTPSLRFKSKATANAKCTLAFCRATVTQKGLYYGMLYSLLFHWHVVGLLQCELHALIVEIQGIRNTGRPLAGRIWPRHKKMPSSVVIARVSRYDFNFGSIYLWSNSGTPLPLQQSMAQSTMVDEGRTKETWMILDTCSDQTWQDLTISFYIKLFLYQRWFRDILSPEGLDCMDLNRTSNKGGGGQRPQCGWGDHSKKTSKGYSASQDIGSFMRPWGYPVARWLAVCLK